MIACVLWLLDWVVILLAVDWAYLHYWCIVKRRGEGGGSVQSVTTDDVMLMELARIL